MEHSEFVESGGGYKISEALSNFGAPTPIAPTSDQEIKSPGQDVSIAISDAAGGRVHWGERGGNTRGESGRVKKGGWLSLFTEALGFVLRSESRLRCRSLAHGALALAEF